MLDPAQLDDIRGRRRPSDIPTLLAEIDRLRRLLGYAKEDFERIATITTDDKAGAAARAAAESLTKEGF